MSYLTQMLGLGLQNFLSAATGITTAIALINAFVRKNATGIGNVWVYLTRSIIYILLPLSIILSLVLVSQGCIDNIKPYVHAHTLEGKEQIIAQGPAASQIAIKHLGTNGGGFFAANSAHPYENPKPLTDYLEILAISSKSFIRLS
ncbi:potassium-transporting ATPase subunit KdpA, partial [Dolichospermum sp. ST_sed4]|nr:potassium-transporting ATPase subunit KdpA [Dolichospermum sp. ST_sed4]